MGTVSDCCEEDQGSELSFSSSPAWWLWRSLARIVTEVRRSALEEKLCAVPVLTSQRHSVPTVESSAPTTRGSALTDLRPGNSRDRQASLPLQDQGQVPCPLLLSRCRGMSRIPSAAPWMTDSVALCSGALCYEVLNSYQPF